MNSNIFVSLFSILKSIIQHPINQHNKTEALLRFIKWQVGSRLLPGPIIFPWVEGTKFIVSHGETGFTQNIYCGLHDFSEMAYLLHVLTPKDLFVDVGANVGSYTVLACAGRGAQGYCFEPIPTTYRKLMENIKINNLSENVKAFNIGISDNEEELLFTSDKDTMNHVLRDDDRTINTIEIPVSKLDDILKDESPTMIKIDVEGFEGRVINGAIHTLANPKLHSIIMEKNHSCQKYGLSEDESIRNLNKMGFNEYTYEPMTRKLRKDINKNNKQNNLIFIRNIELVEERILKATPVYIFNYKV
jgi:FkbM family methyltransferase